MVRKIVTVKRWLWAAAVWLAALPASAGDDGFLWSVRDSAGETRGHLFGTVHLCSARCYPLPAKARAAFRASRRLALELDPADPSIGPALNLAGRLPDAAPGLSERIPARQWRWLVDTARQQGLPPSVLSRMQPWLASMSLMVGAAGQAGYGPQWGVDLWLAGEARRAGIEVLALETVARQIEAMSAGGEAAQLAALAQTVALINAGRVDEYFDAMLRAWRRGDGAALAQLLEMDADAAAMAPLLDELLAQRNHEMAAALARLLAGPGPVFVAVGAAHLDGPDGLAALLARKGFVLERLRDGAPE